MFKSLLIKISFHRKKYKSNVCIIKRKSLIEIFEGDVRISKDRRKYLRAADKFYSGKQKASLFVSC